MINKIEVDAIRSRAEKGDATSDDCLNVLRYFDDSVQTADFTNEVIAAVEGAIESSISQSSIVRSVEDAVARLRS